MSLFDIVAILLTLAALLSYLNERYLGLPTTVGLMLISLALSLGLLGAEQLGWHMENYAVEVLAKVNFSDLLLHGMLAFLLFAGALHVNLEDLLAQKWIISFFATAGVLISAALVASLTWLSTGALGIQLPWIYCLIFGALISPTDPIAVLGVIKSSHAPKSLETKITGESLFNDGVGVVLFIVLIDIARGAHTLDGSEIGLLFLREAAGGALFGLVAGLVTYWLLKSVDHYPVEILLTLALVAGGYALAEALHLSAPIAMVVAGLLIGNQGRALAMSQQTCDHLDSFWELVDEILNAVLFVLIGLEVLLLPFRWATFVAGLAAVPTVLLARWISVGIPLGLVGRRGNFAPNVIKIMTWGGLRGGISVALALSLPAGEAREVILPVTYSVVVFSILVQGLTIKKLFPRPAAGLAIGEVFGRE